MKQLFPLIIASILCFSCTKEQFSPEQAQTTDELLSAFYSPGLFVSYSVSGSITSFSLSDGTSLDVDSSSTPVYSASDGIFPDVCLEKGRWCVNGVSTGISSTEGLGNLRSKVVCVAYDCDAIVIYLSNGNILHIPSSESGSLWGFKFRREDNPSLSSDVNCSILRTSLIAEVPYGCLAEDLCPDISFRGKGLTINGQAQRNRCSKQNFSGKVEYVLTLFDDRKLTYTVELNEPYPTVRLYTENCVSIGKSDYVDGTIKITDPGKAYWDIEEFTSPMKIRGRGNSTWSNFPKKPYKIKLDEKTGIFGMSKNRDWAMLANYTDKSLLRNALAMRVSEICGMSWTPKIFNVDVYLNDNYIGSYDFTEHKEVAKHRVNIDIDAGDCYLEIEAKKDNPVCFDTKMGFPIMFTDPEQPSPALQDEIVRYFDDFEASLVSASFKDPQKGYRAYVDVDSFVNNYIIQELSKNIDADLFKSLFLVKRKNGPLEFYHVWDFDLAWGNCNYLSAHEGVTNGPEGWYIRNHTQNGIDTGWYWYMFQDPWFVSKVKSRWTELYPSLLALSDEIRKTSRRIRGSAGRNFTRWPILDTYVWPNLVWLGDYDAEVDYLLDFYTRRLEWMNTQLSVS